MIAGVGLLNVVIGVAIAYVAERLPGRTELLETGAGLLLIAGLALSGCALPAML